MNYEFPFIVAQYQVIYHDLKAAFSKVIWNSSLGGGLR